VFKEGGLVTAGNASQLSDGGAALVVMSEKAAEKHGVTPLARIGDYATSGTKPEWVMEAPIPTVRKLLKKAGLSIGDFELVEHNEAYAAASVAVARELGIPPERLNVHGGAVALGHPRGCTGARILTTLVYAMRDRGSRRGPAALCLGGGNAMAMIVGRTWAAAPPNGSGTLSRARRCPRAVWGYDVLRCRVCGTPVASDFLFCPECGTTIPAGPGPAYKVAYGAPHLVYAPSYPMVPSPPPRPRGFRARRGLLLSLAALVVLWIPMISIVGALLLSLGSTLIYWDRGEFGRPHRSSVVRAYALFWLAAAVYTVVFLAFVSAAYS